MKVIEKAKDIIAKGETAGVREWTYEEGADDVMDAGDMPLCAEVAPDDAAYIASANPAALLPILRAFVEMAAEVERLKDVNRRWMKQEAEQRMDVIRLQKVVAQNFEEIDSLREEAKSLQRMLDGEVVSL